MSVPGAKVPTARILVVGVCGIGVLNCGFSPSVCSATVTSLFRRGVARWTPCHEAERVANAAAIFLIYARTHITIRPLRTGCPFSDQDYSMPHEQVTISTRDGSCPAHVFTPHDEQGG